MTIPKTKSHIKFYIFLLLIIVGFIINSCRKDSSNNKELAATNSSIVSLAKQWYNVTYPTAGKFTSDAATQGSGAAIQDWSKTFSPYWAKANTFVIDSLTYIELPALKKGNMAMSLKPEVEPSQFNFSTSGSLTSLIIVNKNSAFYVYAMTILADSSYLKGDYSKVSNNTYRYKDKDFSGMVFYNRMDGSFVNGWQYKNGVITGVVTQTPVTGNPATTGTLGVTNPRVHVRVAESCSTTLTTTYWEDCSYYENDTYDQNPFNCYDYTTQGLSTSCTPTSTSSGGGSSTTTPPCNPPSSGAAVEGFRQISDVAAPPSGSGGIVDQTNQIGTSQCLPATVTPPPPANTPRNPAMVKDLLSKMHTSTLTTDELANFTTTINQIDATIAGDAMLSALDAYYIANPTAATLTVTDVAPTNATDNFDPNTNTINMGSTYQDGNFASYDIYNTAHEMYHEYETINGQSPYQSNFELDAYMFATQVIEGVPSDFGTTAYETQIEVPDPTTTAQTNFNTAWGNFLNGNTTTANYAILDNNFLSGSKVGPNYTIYNGQTVTNSPSSTPLFETN